MRQERDEDRATEQTLDLGFGRTWNLPGAIPSDQLTRLDRKLMEEFYPKQAAAKTA